MATIVPDTDSSLPKAATTIVTIEIKDTKTTTTPRKDRLKVGEALKQGESLWSPNGEFRLTLQNDGNLCMYTESGAVNWSTDTEPGHIKAVMRHDGNFVVLNDRGYVGYQTGTDGKGGKRTALIVQDDGNLVIQNNTNVIWFSNTARPKPARKPRTMLDRLEVGQDLVKDEFLVSPNGRFRLLLQGDGEFRLYQDKVVLWSTDTFDRDAPSSRVVLEADGELRLLRDKGKQTWTSGTKGLGSATSVLILQDDANVVLLSDSKKIWASNTKPRVPDRLESGQALWPGNELVSPNQKFRLAFQGDGNLVLYEGNKSRWASNTGETKLYSAKVTMRDDDDLVMTDQHKTLWASGTHRRAGGGIAILSVLDSGDAVVTSDGVVIWSTSPKLVQRSDHIGTTPVPSNSNEMRPGQYLAVGKSMSSQNNQFKLTVTTTGKVTITRTGSDDIIWSYNPEVTNIAKLQLTWNAGLVLYDTNGNQIWTEGGKDLEGKGGTILKNDGNLATHDLERDWQTDTRFPVFDGPTDTLLRGERLSIDQSLTADNYRLTFTSTGHLCSTDATGRATYYYNEETISNARTLIFNENSQMEFRDTRNDLVGTMGSSLRHLQLTKSQFKFQGDGHVRIYANGGEKWKTSDLGSGSSSTKPVFNDTLLPDGKLKRGEELKSSNGQYKFRVTAEGKVCLFGPSEEVLFDTGSKGDWLMLQYDGTLVEMRTTWPPVGQIWRGNPWTENRRGNVRFVVQNDGNAVVYSGNLSIWATGTAKAVR